MKHKIILAITLSLFILKGSAQQFINKGTIEFEVISNAKKGLPSGSFWDQIKETLPTFKTAYYNYTFADNKSIYKFDHYDEKKAKVPEFLSRGEDENEWYTDFNTGQIISQKNLGSTLNIKDSLRKIQWKLTNESRLIAGFNCRKAVGVILDSVYVFAFYTDEITITGGPCTLNGLPGMILGVTIPRLYTSLMATKLSVTDVKENMIKPVSVKKYFSNKELNDIITKRMKDDFANQEMDEGVKNYINQMVWNAML